MAPAHADLLFEGLRDERLYEFINEEPPESVERLRARYQKLSVGNSPDGTEVWLNWVIWSTQESRYVGYVQATVQDCQVAEIAYLLLRDAWSKGYAREAIAAMVVHLREHYRVTALHARVDPRNKRSVSVLEALGFAQIAYRVDGDRIRGLLADEAEYALVLS